MTTKKRLAEQVLLKLLGGKPRPDREIDIRELMLDLDQLRDEYIKMSFYENMKEGGYFVDQEFLSTYTESISAGSFSLPAKPIDLPRNMGVYIIYGEDIGEPFNIVDAGSMFIHRDKEELYEGGQYYIYFIGNTGKFKKVPTGLTTVNIVMVASSEDIDEDDEYPLTPDARSSILSALEAKYKLKLQLPHDEIEDGNK